MQAFLKKTTPNAPTTTTNHREHRHDAQNSDRSREGEICVRFLSCADIPSLLELEQKKWTDDQRADAAMLASRIAAFPALSVGAFCTRSGTAQASLFMKPTRHDHIRQCPTWADCARKQQGDEAAGTDALFGISLSSVDPKAANAIFEFFWPYALKQGWSVIYLGSPVPGLRDWRSKKTRVSRWRTTS
nr:hypothetical protein GCM10020185_75360 [Pseudomonas brassicacearum subsp. brassicacearum]